MRQRRRPARQQGVRVCLRGRKQQAASGELQATAATITASNHVRHHIYCCQSSSWLSKGKLGQPRNRGSGGGGGEGAAAAGASHLCRSRGSSWTEQLAWLLTTPPLDGGQAQRRASARLSIWAQARHCSHRWPLFGWPVQFGSVRLAGRPELRFQLERPRSQTARHIATAGQLALVCMLERATGRGVTVAAAATSATAVL